MTETYRQMQDRHRAELGTLRMFWACSDEQFDEGCEKYGIDPGSTKGHVYRILPPEDRVHRLLPHVFVLKEDLNKLENMLDRQERGKEAAFKDPEFMYGAFLYEIEKHEYLNNTAAAWSTLNVFKPEVLEYSEDKAADDYMDEIGFPNEIKAQFHKALGDHMRYAAEHDWY